MKQFKFLALILALAMIVGFFAGCASGKTPDPTTTGNDAADTTTKGAEGGDETPAASVHFTMSGLPSADKTEELERYHNRQAEYEEKTGNTYVTEHVVGIGKAEGVPQEIVDGLRANFEGECSEVGMYLAMARVAEREGYPEIAEAYKRYAYEEADHASRFAELLGEVVTDSTKKNLMMRAEAECGACAGKMDLAKKAKALNLDAIHDTVHEMAKDEARHGRGFEGLLKRYFNTEV